MNKKTVFWLAAASVAGPALALLVGRALAARRLQHDVAGLFAQSAERNNEVYRETQLAELPAPVQRYFRHVLRDGQPYLRGLRLRHGGQFKTDLQGDWVNIQGEQYLTAEPPAFIWQGSTRLFTARDEFVQGRGSLSVRLLGVFPIMHGQGPEYDQGELLRWLGESVWMPTNLLPGKHLRWEPVDEHRARLFFTHGGQTVSYLVRFNERDEIEECETQRHQGDQGLLPWVGRTTKYRRLHGVRVPTVIEGSWVMDGRRQAYAHFTVDTLEYDQRQAF